jgi:hypothetical protein
MHPKGPNFFLKGGWGAVLWNLVFPSVFLMIPSCSHQVPNGFVNVPYVPCVPNSSTLYPICFYHIGSPKGKTTLCLFWEWQKFAHHNTYITRPCGQVLF